MSRRIGLRERRELVVAWFKALDRALTDWTKSWHSYWHTAWSLERGKVRSQAWYRSTATTERHRVIVARVENAKRDFVGAVLGLDE